MFSLGVLPYYLHLLDPVRGTAHFRVEAAQAVAIVHACTHQSCPVIWRPGWYAKNRANLARPCYYNNNYRSSMRSALKGNSVSEHPLLNLLIVDRSQPDIELIVQTLRAAGYLVQANHSAWIKEIRNLIDYRPLDMILVRQGADLPTIAEIRALLEASAQDVPVIAIADDLIRQRSGRVVARRRQQCVRFARVRSSAGGHR